MSTPLDTYDSGWRRNANEVNKKLQKFYASDKTDDGLRTSDEILTNQFFRIRQAELRKVELDAHLSQFKTIEDCIKHYENELNIEVKEIMAEYINNDGTLKDESTRMNDSLAAALCGEYVNKLKPMQYPEDVKKLSYIQEASLLKTAEGVYNQFNIQYDRIEGDFIAAMNSDNGQNHNVTSLHSNKVEARINHESPENS